MYSGQQKFATSISTFRPMLPPPLLLSPKPWPRAPVGTGVLPAAGSGVGGRLSRRRRVPSRAGGLTGPTAAPSGSDWPAAAGARAGSGATGAAAAPPICVMPARRSGPAIPRG